MRITGEQFGVLTYDIAYDQRLKDALYSVLCNGREVADVADDMRIGRDWLLVTSQALVARHEDMLEAYCAVEKRAVERD